MIVTVTIHPDDNTEIDVDGFAGQGCDQITEAVIKALGGKKITDEKKPEYYQGVGASGKVKVKS